MTAGEKRVGEAAKGMPKNLFTTVAEAPETDVAVPMTTPASMVAVGACPPLGADRACPTRPARATSPVRRIVASFTRPGTGTTYLPVMRYTHMYILARCLGRLGGRSHRWLDARMVNDLMP